MNPNEKNPFRQLHSPRQAQPPLEGFKIRKVADLMGDNEPLHDLHRHDYFFIHALLKGRGKQEIDFTPHTVQDLSIFLLRPGKVHQLKLKEGVRDKWVNSYPLFCKKQ